MKRIFLFFIIILLYINIAYSQEDNWFFNSKNLVINLDVSSEAKINPISSDYIVKYIDVNLSHYPYEYFGQEVVSFDFEPDAKIENNALLFSWQAPRNRISFGYNAKIRTKNDIVKVKEKIPFPILDLPEDLDPYTEPSEIIDSNDEDVIGFAAEIAEGEDDLYEVVHRLAEWTKSNIKYDLSTLTEKVSQKASWVLDNRQGVCDELTSLFIAMLRSLGIPAKFISGVAYTESELFTDNWGSHGWAEVYFPGYGWVPYDVTYGQFGYIDPTHIKLKESVDSNEPSVQYKWVASNIDIDTEKLDIKASVEEKIGSIQDIINLDAEVLKENIGFGSYNLIEAILENTEDYYTSSEIYLSRPKEVEIIGEAFKNVLLRPNEKKSVFWIVKLADGLRNNFIYTFPITIGTIKGAEANGEFKSKEDDITYTLAEINSILEQKKEEEEKTYSRELKIECELEREEFYYYENAKVLCNIKNIGNTNLKNLNVCFESDCEKTDLSIIQEKSFNYTVEKEIAGKQESAFKVYNFDVSKAEYVEYTVLDAPKISIKEIKAPEEAEYNDNFKFEFLLSKDSFSVPKNVNINFKNNNFKQTWTLEELAENRKIAVNMAGKELSKGNNELSVLVEYEDGNGRKDSAKESFNVKLVNVTFVQNILLAFNRFVLFLNGLVA
ncbi:MAG: transglutaminase domain-containing protein [Nanoarchaeota archaeon]